MIRLHLDADASRKSLHKALLERGHDVTRTPDDWIPRDATDEQQLLRATTRSRTIFTFNIADFVRLTQAHPDHAGVLLAAQRKWMFQDLLTALDRFLREADPGQMRGQVAWLNQWRDPV